MSQWTAGMSRPNESLPWDLRRRGSRDAIRHNQKVREAVRKGARELIAEEAIITSDGTKRVTIPIRYLDQYRFRYGTPQNGVGQGQGKPGDTLGRRGGDRNAPGEGMPGDRSGEHTFEEFTVEELTEMMLQDLGLPWLEEKPERQIITTSHRYTDVRKKGKLANLDKKRMLLENIKRNAGWGDPHVGHLKDSDLRFKVWDPVEQYHTNAAVYMVMDASGSMTTEKKYIAKSFFFWMVRFLRMKYTNVDIVFIAHDVDAQVIPKEEEFFALSASGGTRCSSAYQVALEHIRQHHPKAIWNNYLFHFSDGDNLPNDNDTCCDLVNTLLEVCKMVGYGEIRYGDDASFYGWIGQTSFTPSSLQYKFNEKVKHPRFISTTITNKDEVYKALEAFLEIDKKKAAA